MKTTRETGDKGEEMAVKYLLSNDYEILERNYYSHPREIDIIALKNDVLHVIEVKTRTGDYFEHPSNAVSLKKQKFLIDASEKYIEKKGLDISVSFDIISIILEKDTIEHVVEAFFPEAE